MQQVFRSAGITGFIIMRYSYFFDLVFLFLCRQAAGYRIGGHNGGWLAVFHRTIRLRFPALSGLAAIPIRPGHKEAYTGSCLRAKQAILVAINRPLQIRSYHSRVLVMGAAGFREAADQGEKENRSEKMECAWKL